MRTGALNAFPEGKNWERITRACRDGVLKARRGPIVIDGTVSGRLADAVGGMITPRIDSEARRVSAGSWWIDVGLIASSYAHRCHVRQS